MITNKRTLLLNLKNLNELIENKAKAHFSTIDASQYHIDDLLKAAVSHIASLEYDEIDYDYPISLQGLIISLVTYLNSNPIPETNDQKTKCGDVVKRILKVLRYCISIPNKSNSLRSVSEKTIQDELKKLRTQRDYIAKQIENEEKERPNSSTLSDLKLVYKELEERLEQLRLEKKESENDDMLEKDWDQRIKDSFNYLSNQTQCIKERRQTLDAEYHIFLYALFVLAILMVIWFCKLYGYLEGIGVIKIETYTHLLPFYIPVPIMAALFWLCIVQKNRASKLLIALDEELFRINYLQGLLLATNKLAETPQSAIKRINKALNSLTNSFLHQTENYNMADKIQNLDIKGSDVTENLSTIKDLITVLKK